MRKFKIGIIQSHVYEDKDLSLENASKLIKKVATADADIIVLPEMFNCPYEAKNFPIYAEEITGHTWRFLSDMAKEQGVYIVGGSIPVFSEEEKILNSAFVFDREGNEIANHNKMHLFDIDIEGGQRFKESDTLSPGKKVTVFETEYCKIGLAICYDIRFPELSRLMADKGAEVIIIPGAFNLTTGPDHWELVFRGRALDNQVYTVGVAPARDMNASYHSFGHSLIVNPWGEVVASLEEKEDVLVYEIDLDMVNQIREQLPLTKHIRRDVYTLEEINTES